MLLLDKSVCTPDAQCNAKMCALAESLQRMYDITSPKRASPRRNTLVDPLSLYIYIYTIGPDRQPGQHEKEHTSDRLDIRPTNYIRPTGYTRPTGHIRPTEMCPVMFVQRCPRCPEIPSISCQIVGSPDLHGSRTRTSPIRARLT